MAARNTKKIGTHRDNAAEARRHNWEVMKPFVHFSIKAMAVIASALFAIIKIIPKAIADKPAGKNDRIIKI
jgi:hypothetical protein